MKTTDEEIKRAYAGLDQSKWNSRIRFEISALELLGIHGALCLSLRYPLFKGPTSTMVRKFIEVAEARLIESGLVKQEHLDLAHRVEEEETEPSSA